MQLCSLAGVHWLCPDARLLLASLALGLLLDRLYPWHSGLLLAIHPVRTTYVLALRLAPPGSSRARGVIAWFVVVAGHLAIYSFALYVAWMVSPLVWLAIAAYIVKVSCPLYPLFDVVEKIRKCMYSGDWVCARRYTQWIVRRDVAKLDEKHVVSAALESLAESLVDGYTSPITYYVLFGPIGSLFQRLVNTMDSALGYKTPEYIEAGWFSARMDDLINYLPARLTALTMIAAALALPGFDAGRAWRVWRRWASATESPNAGHPMAALAGALGVWLEKPGHYVINPEGVDPEPGDLPRGLKLARVAALLYTVGAAALLLF
ncbi:cobalamin biosynthesis protein CobD [Pyrolobus fumarii 1A]|uniref:Probable cobalamin biosynthesis protein CobD n=1 Tax=Pyrolobus fumarii (strain DSM 11204 / 1A) TaxID=694429 RepID=G0EGQ9_PYRF1|nr:cobalamin biosynthesis protein [Pyrolobus fumarii]AEM39207.1 cobalamin biosynthesis protein CobD [Pyrolobus fumarii 1A]